MPAPLLISDCRSTGLVDERATITWLCAPRMDAPAIVASALDPRAGAIETIVEGAEPAGQRHRPGTLVVETDLRCPTGMLRVTDCLAIPPRGPGGPDDPGELVRLLTVLEGRVRVGVRIALRYGFGLHAPRWIREGRRTRAVGPGPTVDLDTDVAIRPQGGDIVGVVELERDQTRVIALRWQDPAGLGEDVRGRARETAAWWRSLGDLSPDQALLRGLVFHPTGGVVRSATTSLGDPPEDGRLCFMSDQPGAARALRAAGLGADADRVEAWLAAAAALGDAPVRGLAGEPAPAALFLDHLARPVAVGAPSGDAAGNLPYLPDLVAAAAA